MIDLSTCEIVGSADSVVMCEAAAWVWSNMNPGIKFAVVVLGEGENVDLASIWVNGEAVAVPLDQVEAKQHHRSDYDRCRVSLIQESITRGKPA